VISKAFAQTNAAPMIGVTSEATGNVLVALWFQIINNPSSLSDILFLMVMAWLCDDLPWPPSKYVKHVTVMLGILTYWAFTNPETVSKIYPHPLAIYLCNGSICGATAYLAHWQIVTRVRDFLSNKKEQQQNQTP
jgi:hypothetical protein